MNKQERILKFAESGLNPAAIAAKVGCNKAYVYVVLSRNRKMQPVQTEEPKPWVGSVEQLVRDVEMELAKKEQEARELSHFLTRLKERVDAASV